MDIEVSPILAVDQCGVDEIEHLRRAEHHRLERDTKMGGDLLRISVVLARRLLAVGACNRERDGRELAD
jgi:hypothetical protein